MKMSRVIVLALALGAAAASARAEYYLKVDALYENASDVKVDSASDFRTSLKTSLGYSAAFGYKFTKVRVEAELQYFKSSANGASDSTGSSLSASGAYKQFSGFVNGYVDLKSFLGLTPYIGAGLGEAEINLDQLSAEHGASKVVQFSSRNMASGYQAMVGLQYPVLGKATASIGFRILHMGSFQTHDIASHVRQDVSSGLNKIFEIGLAWHF
jgi:opacity protein-like surface antigen